MHRILETDNLALRPQCRLMSPYAGRLTRSRMTRISESLSVDNRYGSQRYAHSAVHHRQASLTD